MSNYQLLTDQCMKGLAEPFILLKGQWNDYAHFVEHDISLS